MSSEEFLEDIGENVSDEAIAAEIERRQKRSTGLYLAMLQYIKDYYPEDTTNGILMHDLIVAFCSFVCAGEAPQEVVDAIVTVVKDTLYTQRGFTDESTQCAAIDHTDQ